MKAKYVIAIIVAGVVTWIYIRYQQMDIEIARFDYMMKVMKEEQKQSEK